MKNNQMNCRRWLVVFLFFAMPMPGWTFTMQSDSSSVEWIKVYFNMPADHSVSLLGNMSKSNADLIGTLETLIRNAEHSVDLAIYDLEHPRIGQALAEAQKRGVQVRLVTDNYNRTDAEEIDSTMWATLRGAGITSIDDDGDIYQTDGGISDYSLTNSGADMHHKFAVIDALSATPGDDKVWTGSTNMTITGAYNTNNTIVIKDSGIAAAYLAQHDIAFQAFAITPSIPLSRTIWQMSATGAVDLHGVIDPMFYYRYKSNGDIWASPEAKLSNRMILPANEMRKLHHKVMLLDANHPNPSDKGVTIAGSYNFSKNAEVNNDENLLIIYSDRITNQYYQDFRGVVRRAQRKGDIPAPPLTGDKWYPVEAVSDGSQFAIEVLPGFEYGVEFLGTDVPRVYAGNDSSEYYSAEASEYLRNLISGAEVRLQGSSAQTPRARYGAFQAYVTLKKDGKVIALNKHLLQQGFAQYEPYYAQDPDSVEAFKAYAERAKLKGMGIWKHPQKIGQKFSRAKVIDRGAEPSEAFPININTANEALLDLLPGIGPAYAGRIIAYREQNGAFTNVAELENIKGIGPQAMQKLRPNVVVE